MSGGLWVSEREFRAFAQPETNLSSHIATRMAAGDLSSFFGLLPNPDPVLRAMGKSIEVYRNLLVDPLVKGGRRRRRAAVLAMERGFDRDDKAQKRVTANVAAVMEDLPLERLISGLCDGAMFGYAVAEIIWGRVGSLVVPVDVVVKPQEWFGFDGETQALKFKPRGSLNGEDLPPNKFLVVGNNRTYDNPYGEPDLAAVFWAVTLIRGGKKFWATFAEKLGTGFLIGKLPRTATPQETDELAAKLQRMVRDAVAVVPDDGSVEILTVGSTANADMYEKLLMYCRSEISIALLGNNQSVEMQSNKASATAAGAVEDELRDADAGMVADGINQLVRFICEQNWPSARPPAYSLWEQEEVDAQLAERDQKLRAAGVRFKAQYFKRAYGLQDGDIDEADEPADTQPAEGAGRRVATGGEDAAEGINRGDQVDLAEDHGNVADQAVIDYAIEQLPADELQAAMQSLLRPAIDAVMQAATPEQAVVALAEAYPRMPAEQLQDLLARALFVSDLVGRDAVRDEDRIGRRLERLADRRQGRD